jgi:hypothetical protein
MKLGQDHIALKLGGELITLRPTLRCGLRLERREGSFAKLIEDLQGDSLSAARFVIEDQLDRVQLGYLILDAGLEVVCSQLVTFVMDCVGIDPDAKAEGKGGSVSFAEHLTSLYRIGTGWLGWTPATTLDATPAEITEAFKGRTDMLKAIFGGESDTKPKSNASSDHLRSVFQEIGTTKVKRGRS